MRAVIAIAKKELVSLGCTPMAYVVIAGFLSMAAFFFFNLLATFRLEVKRFVQLPLKDMVQQPNLNQWVLEPYFHTIALILVLVVPLFTMRALAEEGRRGTLELLLTAPVRTYEIVAGKFIAATLAIVSLILLSFVYPVLLCWFGNPEIGPIFSAFVGLILLATAFSGLGVAASAWSKSQLLAGLSSMVLLLVLFLIHVPVASVGAGVGGLLVHLSARMQLTGYVEGVISTSSVIYFISLIAIAFLIATRGVDHRRLAN